MDMNDYFKMLNEAVERNAREKAERGDPDEETEVSSDSIPSDKRY